MHKTEHDADADRTGAEASLGYLVWNATDGLYADLAVYPTRAAAESAVEAFRARFKRQGYYFTARCERIPPEEIAIEIIEAAPEE